MRELVEFILVFALVVKFIFSSEKVVKTTRLFNSKEDSCPRVVYVKVRSDQAIQVTSAIRKIIKFQQFTSRYNIKVYFSLQFEFS